MTLESCTQLYWRISSDAKGRRPPNVIPITTGDALEKLSGKILDKLDIRHPLVMRATELEIAIIHGESVCTKNILSPCVVSTLPTQQ